MKLASRPEELIMLAIHHLDENAYLVTIREFLSKTTGKDWSVGAVYVPLDRLTKLGYTETSLGESTPERGGRRKKFYTLTVRGYEALREIQRVHDAMWNGFQPPKFDGEYAV